MAEQQRHAPAPRAGVVGETELGEDRRLVEVHALGDQPLALEDEVRGHAAAKRATRRRERAQRAEVGSRSPVWFAAVHRAYDDRLRIACRELEIPEYLQELDGTDLEIERLRVEGLLQEAGLPLVVVEDS